MAQAKAAFDVARDRAATAGQATWHQAGQEREAARAALQQQVAFLASYFQQWDAKLCEEAALAQQAVAIPALLQTEQQRRDRSRDELEGLEIELEELRVAARKAKRQRIEQVVSPAAPSSRVQQLQAEVEALQQQLFDIEAKIVRT